MNPQDPQNTTPDQQPPTPESMPAQDRPSFAQPEQPMQPQEQPSFAPPVPEQPQAQPMQPQAQPPMPPEAQPMQPQAQPPMPPQEQAPAFGQPMQPQGQPGFAPQPGQPMMQPQADGMVGQKDFLTASMLSLYSGGLGIDRFYLGYTGLGIVKLLTLGGCGVWSLIDLILILTGSLKDKQGMKLRDREQKLKTAVIITIVVYALGIVINIVRSLLIPSTLG